MCFIWKATKAGISFAFLTSDGSFSENLKKPVAYIPKYKSLLKSDPYNNRIGIYDPMTLNFRCWFQHPNIQNGKTFNFPSKFLLLGNGHFFILEENQINILNGSFAPYQAPFVGKFMSISMGLNDEVLTTQLFKGLWNRK